MLSIIFFRVASGSLKCQIELSLRRAHLAPKSIISSKMANCQTFMMLWKFFRWGKRDGRMSIEFVQKLPSFVEIKSSTSARA